jgi:hypothetical protein
MKLKLFLILGTLLLSSAAFATEGRSNARWDSNGDHAPVSVPEPSTLVLAGTSLVGLLGAAVRRSRG